MAGIGDSWGTREELLHPRGPDGRWIRKAGIAKGIIDAVLGFLANFRPRTFQNKNQSTQYLHNISRRQGRKRMTNGDLRRLYDLPNANEDLQDGVIDNPSTKQFVDMMDRTETELPDDLIVTTILPTEAFGFSAQTATGTNADTDPGIRGVSGKLGADRGYMPMVIGNPDDSVPVPAGSVRLIVAAPKGTKVNIPGGSSSDPTLFLTRGQPLRITKIKPDGAGGWHMYATAAEARTGEVPTPIGGPRGLQRPPTSEREAAIRDLERIQGVREKRPDEVAEQADIEARQRAAEANAQATPTPSPAQEAERRRVEALPQQPAPGEPPPRTEPAVGRVGEPGAPGAQAPAPTVPEAPPVPRRSVDLRLALRDAGIPSPSQGPRRKTFNENYLGVVQGKKDPIDAIRDLDTDISELRSGRELGRSQGSEEARESDADSLEKLRNLIAKEYGLEESQPRTKAGLPKAIRPEPVKTRLSKREQEAEERNRAAGAAEAIPAPTPAKKAPAKKAAKKAAGGLVRTKDQEDRILSQASKLGGPPRNDEERRILDEAAEISTRRQGGITARRQAGTSTEQESPMKALAPGDDIDKMTKQQLLDEAERRDVVVPKSWTKDKIKAALRDEGFRRPEKKTPQARKRVQASQQDLAREFEQRQAQGEGEPQPSEADLDKMTKRQLIAEAGRRGVTARESWTKDRIKKAIRDREKLADESDEQFRREMREELEAEFEDEAQLERTARELIPEPAKKAAKAAVPGAAPGTAAGKITAGRIQPGMRVLVSPNGRATDRKTGARTLTVTSVDRIAPDRKRGERNTRIQVTGTDENGNEVKVASVGSATTFMVAPEPGAAPVKKAAKAAAPVPEGPSGHPGDTGMARALIPEEQQRQVKLDRVKAYGTIGTEVDELLANGASPKALAHRIRTRGKQQFIPDDDLKDMIDAAEAGDNDRVRRLARGLMDREGIVQIGSTDDVVPLDRNNHQSLDGGGLPRDTAVVHVVRPGSRANVDGDDILIDRAVVEPANADEVQEFEKARRLVPGGSVPGTRTDTPVDNAPRKRELRQAWIAADIQPPSGPVRAQTEEIRDKLLAGDITPEESIRMMESEIALNKEDLAELDAHLREGDLTDAERREFQGRAAKLMQGIEAQEKASKFLRLYFKDEGPVVSLKEAKVQDPVSYEFLKDATPDDMREAAKQAGLDAPSGDTTDEMFKDLLKQVARKELARRAAKKAAKKAPAKAAKKAAPAVPKEKERVDARLLAEGIDGLDDGTIADVQKYFDGEAVPGSGKNPTPAKIADWLNFRARGTRDSTAIIHGSWTESLNPDSSRFDPEYAEKQRLEFERGMARATALEELAGRVRGVRRRSFKKAAPATPEVAKLQDKVDDLEKRRIDDALGELTQSGDNRDRADAVLEGLTLPELRRLAEQSGIPTARTKRGLRDNILDRFAPKPETDLDAIMERLISFENPPSREEATAMVAPLNKAQLLELAQRASIPGARSKNMTQLRREIVEGTAGARLDSIATRGFTGLRPGLGDVAGRPDLPTVGAPPTPRPMSLSRRASGAGIATPGRMFSDVDSAVSEADRRLQGGESPTTVSRFLRERAARVAKADIVEEGRRFPVEYDKSSLLAIRKSSADYLRRVATHVQQEGKASKATPAKKAAPSAPEAPDTQAEVTALRRRARVTRELAGMRQANNPPGSFHHNKGLQDEKEADRLDAEADALERGSAPAPAKKAPAKKAGVPSPSRTGTSPVGGTKSTAPELKNDWGMLGTGGEVEFHDDGVIGQGLRGMGDDRLMDVDGEPLSNVIGKLATRAVRGEITQEQLLNELRRLGRRLPEGSRARSGVASMVDFIDGPKRSMPDLPEDTPAPFRTAIERLLQIPLAREAVSRPGFHRDRGDSEVDKLLRLIQDFHEGRAGGLRMVMEIQDIRGSLPHESQEGRFEADRVLRDLHAELDRMYKDPELRPLLARRTPGAPPAAKKATPRLTAIPGGGSGGGTKKRPKLTVVRNENGEFSFIWGEGDDDHVQLPERELDPSHLYAGSTV